MDLSHPDADDLAFLYGTILTDGGDGAGEPTTNVCVFADGQVDRSPTGSGVGARLALMHRRGLVEVGEMRCFRSLTGGVFEGRVTAAIRAGPHPAVLTEVAGRAFHTGEARFKVEPDDPLSCPVSRCEGTSVRLPIEFGNKASVHDRAWQGAAAEDDGRSHSDARVGYRRTLFRLGAASV